MSVTLACFALCGVTKQCNNYYQQHSSTKEFNNKLNLLTALKLFARVFSLLGLFGFILFFSCFGGWLLCFLFAVLCFAHDIFSLVRKGVLRC